MLTSVGKACKHWFGHYCRNCGEPPSVVVTDLRDEAYANVAPECVGAFVFTRNNGPITQTTHVLPGGSSITTTTQTEHEHFDDWVIVDCPNEQPTQTEQPTHVPLYKTWSSFLPW